jgi:hypothetical protein
MKLLDIYVAITFCTIIMITMIAMKLLHSHGMSSGRILNLAVLAGVVWPLLAFAAFQAGGALVLAKGLGMVNGQPKGPALPFSDVRRADSMELDRTA